jgi:superfamily II DNA helicase RecQ
MLASYLRKKKAVLIFCPTKNQCEQVAKRLAMQLPIQYPEYAQKENLTYGDVENEVRDMI